MAYKSRFKEISDIDFENAVASSLFMVDVLEKLGYSRTSGTMTKFIKKRIEDNNIDISHFLGKKGSRGGGSIGIDLNETLIDNSTYYNRTSLKARLFKSNLLENKCIECGIGSIWNGKKLVLHLDHINGKYNDNRIENLRILCPNCHSQTDTYSGKNMKK